MTAEHRDPLDFTRLLNDSYERLLDKNHQAFIDRFYQHFIAASPAVARAFAKTDMAHQTDMLHLSLLQMMAFAADRQASPYLTRIALQHANLAIGRELYDLWLQCLLKTVQELDERYDATVELAWRVTLAPGLEFMRAYGELTR